MYIFSIYFPETWIVKIIFICSGTGNVP